jgi:hypothetical protein
MNTRDLAAMIQKMKPGQCCRVSRDTFRTLEGGLMENNYDFPLKDWVLEHIIGSSYEYGYNEDLATGDVNYFRLLEPLTDGRRSYVSPDRLTFYRKRFDGTYEPLRNAT